MTIRNGRSRFVCETTVAGDVWILVLSGSNAGTPILGNASRCFPVAGLAGVVVSAAARLRTSASRSDSPCRLTPLECTSLGTSAQWQIGLTADRDDRALPLPLPLTGPITGERRPARATEGA